MAEAIDAAIDEPEQPADAYLAACSALLMALATNSTITDEEADVLLDAMPDPALREGLRFGLGEIHVTESNYIRTLR